MDLMNYVVEEALVLVPVLVVIGKILKGTQVKDKYIPIILGLAGIGLTLSTLGLSVQSAVQGILIAGASVYGNQLFKQSKKPS